jgi:uncharacterized protein YfdQ (DUF2303 family)
MDDAILSSNPSTAERIEALKAAALAPRQIGQSHHLVVPDGYTHIDISKEVEARDPIPHRKRGTVALESVQSLLDYCEDQKAQGTAYIYASQDTLTITAVFNDHRDEFAGWRDHRATFKAAFTPEFERWIANNGSARAKEQMTFAEFIEDNIADITEPAGAQLLEVATTIQAKTDINFSSARRLDNGQVQLGYTETINATAGANSALSIPREFALGLRVFKNGEGYRLTARLKYRLNNGGVKFWYELDRPERVIEDAFAGYVEQVRATSGYRVLIGQA